MTSMSEAIAAAVQASQMLGDRARQAATAASDQVMPGLYQFVERSTETVGHVVTPIAENPLVRFATKVPGISWLMAALGQVDVDRVQQEVSELKRTYPLETQEQLAQRIITETTWKAAGVGLATNLIPPFALMLFAVDLGAIAALQANMIYRIATIYGFSPKEPTRRGEVLAIWGLLTGGSSVLKTGLSVVELIPGLGTVIGTAGDATLLYSLGFLACRFYEEKQNVVAKAARDNVTTV